MSSISAPSVWKMRLTLAFCRANPNWMPRKPKHMFQICQNDSCGLRSIRCVPHWSTAMVVSGAGAQSACKRIHRRRARGGNMLQCGPWNSGAPASRAQWPAALSSRHVVGTRMATAPWWRGAVIYQIYPRSFLDTNSDGVDDLPGIIARLDHVATLGVDAIWVSPFFTSPMADYGYDIADFRDVDPMFGTLADFDRLLAQAHARGIRVMIDQVLSHSSDQHPWFTESRASRDNPRADW